jgi:hypothetical protein
MLGYTVSSELAISVLGRPFWTDRLPNLYTSGLTRSEIDPLVICWRESLWTKTRGPPLRAAWLRLQFFAMRKAGANQCAKEALLNFRTTEVFVKRALDRFREFLITLPSAPDTRQEQVDKIRKLGRILFVNMGVLDVSWVQFLRGQCIIDHDDLD